jgi:NhaP-type Na+/H+ or K+/H+ antiporter
MLILAFTTASRFTTAATCSAFLTSLLHCLLIDIVVGQPLGVLLTVLYRWMTSDADNRLSSELHPIHHQRRDESSA